MAKIQTDKEPRPLVLIEWVDSCGCSTTWEDLSGIGSKPTTCKSVGWLVREDKWSKVVVPHVFFRANEAEQGCGDMTIPIKCITRIVKLPSSKL